MFALRTFVYHMDMRPQPCQRPPADPRASCDDGSESSAPARAEAARSGRHPSFRRKESGSRMRTIDCQFDGRTAPARFRVAPPLLFARSPLHLHDIEEDHYHGINEYNVDHEKFRDSLWEADNVDLVSVGIDIGSSGTQVVFSRIWLKRLSDNLSSRYVVVDREQLYQSPVSLTPYAAGL